MGELYYILHLQISYSLYVPKLGYNIWLAEDNFTAITA